MNEKGLIRVIVGLFMGLGILYAVTTPVFEASDELWHYPMIRHLADGHPLPVQVFDPAQAGPWKQEASQPPLYYYVGAALTFWIDTADMGAVRWLNPHVDNGVITADGNNNLTIHDPAWNPWQGTLLAVRIVRIFSVFLSAVTVYLTYRIGREVLPERPEIGLGAAAINAFMPMFLFISGAVNNDNLAVPLASLALWLMIYLGVKRPLWDAKASLVLGIVIGLAVLTKEGTFGLLPLAGGTIFIALWRRERTAALNGRRLLTLLAQTIGYSGLLLIPVLLIAGWWYYRNIVLYGDWLGWSAFIAVLGQRAHPASLAQLWDERWGFMLSYWGLFGGVNVPMPTWIYQLLNGVLITAVIGFVLYLLREAGQHRQRLQAALLTPRTWLVSLFTLVERYFALVICLLFSTAVVLGLIQWATTTWSSQGRLVFTAISTLTILLMVGLGGWLPRHLGTAVIAMVAAFMLGIAVAAPFLWIRPAYQPGGLTPPSEAVLVDVSFGQQISLVQYVLRQSEVAYPGDTIDLVLVWQVEQAMARDWSVFVHLNDPVLERPIAQRDMYLGQGLRPTSLLSPGDRLVNHYQLRLPQTAAAPAELALTVGLYDFYTGERLPLTTGQDTVTLTTLSLAPKPGTYPNAVQVNFEETVTLVGYEVTPRRVRPGESIELTLYWQAQRPLTADYTFFAQVVDLTDTTRWASQDLPQMTTAWPPSEVQAIPMTLTLADDTPPDVYPVIVGLYTQTADGGFDRLQMITADGRLTDDFLLLTYIRVGP